MRQLAKLALGVFLAGSMVACLPAKNSDTSRTKVDVALSPSEVDVSQVRDFIRILSEIAASPNGQGTLNPADFFSFFPMTEAEKQQILQPQPNLATVLCRGQGCRITAPGVSDGKIRLSLVDIPGLGSPTMWIDKTVMVELLIQSPDALELCRITGVQIKKGVWVKFDGANLNTLNNTYSIDLGLAGSYPKNCLTF
jgi:hypothetical protein